MPWPHEPGRVTMMTTMMMMMMLTQDDDDYDDDDDLPGDTTRLDSQVRWAGRVDGEGASGHAMSLGDGPKGGCVRHQAM
jgi:hypothetical protein